MSLLTVDVGGANETSLRLVRAGNAERRQIGKKRYAFAGNERSMIRAEKIVCPVQLLAVPAADAAVVRSLFALGAIVNCEGDVFNNGNATIRCMGEITDEMEVGGPYWNLSLTLREVDGATSSVDETPPSVTATLVNWYDAQGTNFTALGLIDGDPVTTWPDESGNGFNAPSGNASFTGAFDTGSLNGHPGVYFAPLGNNQRGYDLPNDYSPTEGEAFIVLRAAVGGGGPFWMFGEITTGPYLPNTSAVMFRDDFGSTTARSFPIAVTPTNPFLYHVRSRAGQFRAWINGTLVYSSAINTPVWPPVQHLGIWLSGGAFYQPATLWIGEALFYDGFLTSSAAATKEAAMKTKWSIP